MPGAPENGDAVIESTGKARGLFEGKVQAVDLPGAGSRDDDALRVPDGMMSPAIALKIR